MGVWRKGWRSLDISMLDEKGEEGSLEEVEVRLCKEKFEELWRLLKAKDALIVQRSRAKWLKEGDANSKFFHNCLKSRMSRNTIKALKVDDGWAVSPLDIRRKVVEYFTSHMADIRWEQPRLDGVMFAQISGEDNGYLVAPFTMPELEAVVRESDSSKSPGPDGFNFAFVKKIW